MSLPVEHLKDTILAMLGQLKEARCAALEMGIDTEGPEEIEVSVTLIAPAGLNLISRKTTQSNGTRVDITEHPEKIETQTSDPVTSTSTAEPATSTTTQTQNEPKKIVTRISFPRTSTTTKSATPSITETTENQDANQTGWRQEGGGDRQDSETILRRDISQPG